MAELADAIVESGIQTLIAAARTVSDPRDKRVSEGGGELEEERDCPLVFVFGGEKYGAMALHGTNEQLLEAGYCAGAPHIGVDFGGRRG